MRTAYRRYRSLSASRTHPLVFWCLLALTLLLITPAAAQTDARPAVLSAERARFNAMVAADTTALRPLLHPDLLYIHSNGLEESATDLVASVASGGIVYRAFAALQPPRVWVRGRTALVDGTVEVSGYYRGTAFDVPLRYTSVYYRARGRWRLIRWQSLNVSEP